MLVLLTKLILILICHFNKPVYNKMISKCQVNLKKIFKLKLKKYLDKFMKLE